MKKLTIEENSDSLNFIMEGNLQALKAEIKTLTSQIKQKNNDVF